uniref:Protein FAM50 homolog n=1 Tax=Nicotiana tabacum TaxID=4097 RepID=A0A1S3X1N9_TOBAC|nr:PREDICTED: protein FAM50 homolog [Nicotiana tabacum]
MANFSVSQLQQKIEMIRKLREEVNELKAESLKYLEGMDRLAAEREAARAQLSSAKNQFHSMKKKSSVQARRIEELEAQLASKLVKAESNAEKAKADGCTCGQIKRAKELEVDTEALVSDDDDDDDDDDDGSKSGYENGGEPDRKETAPWDNEDVYPLASML